MELSSSTTRMFGAAAFTLRACRNRLDAEPDGARQHGQRGPSAVVERVVARVDEGIARQLRRPDADCGQIDPRRRQPGDGALEDELVLAAGDTEPKVSTRVRRDGVADLLDDLGAADEHRAVAGERVGDDE